MPPPDRLVATLIWYRDIARATPAALFLYNVQQGTLVLLNQELHTILGRTLPHAIPDEAWLAMLHPDDAHQLREELKVGETSKLATTHERFLRLRTGDGQWRKLLWRSRPFYTTPSKTPLVLAGLLQPAVLIDSAVAALFGSTSAALCLLDNARRVLQVTGAFASAFGVKPPTMRGTAIDQWLPAECVVALASVQNGYSVVAPDTIHLYPDQMPSLGLEFRPLRLADEDCLLITATPVHPPAPQPPTSPMGAEVTFHDLFESAPHAIMVETLDGTVIDVNPAACTLHHMPRSDLIGKNVLRGDLAPDNHHLSITHHTMSLHDQQQHVFEGYSLRSDGTTIPVEVYVQPITYQGAPALLKHVYDISGRKATEEQLQALVMYDPLTGLPSLSLFTEQLQNALHSTACTLFFIDFDNFQTVNDSMGYRVGDELLQLLTVTLQETVPPDALLGRYGSDEFVLLFANNQIGAALQLANRLHAALERPLAPYMTNHTLTVSIGIAIAEEDILTAEDLLSNASIALYEAKTLGRGRTVLYDGYMRERTMERIWIENELRTAVQRDELVLHFQPIVAFKSGQVIAFEALVRWQHPQRGLLFPGQFIHIAETSGLIADIDRVVLQQACRHMQQWLDHLPAHDRLPFKVGLNFSGLSFMQLELVEQVVEVLQERMVDPRAMTIEVTETVAMKNVDITARTLRRLGEYGLSVSLDDFGTGYSSLEYLQRFPIQTLKIDASFVRRMAHDRDSAVIVQAVISLAHTLGLRVVAEGVETVEQYSLLQVMGCDYGQGYWFARPVEGARVPELAQQRLPLGIEVRRF